MNVLGIGNAIVDVLCRIDEKFLTENSLTKQYSALMQTEGITLKFEDSGIKALAKIAAEVNASIENIGARRLYTILEKVFENLSYSAPDQKVKKMKIL